MVMLIFYSVCLTVLCRQMTKWRKDTPPWFNKRKYNVYNHVLFYFSDLLFARITGKRKVLISKMSLRNILSPRSCIFRYWFIKKKGERGRRRPSPKPSLYLPLDYFFCLKTKFFKVLKILKYSARIERFMIPYMMGFNEELENPKQV